MAGAPSDWQLECVEVKQRGAYLLQSGQWSDCTFLVGSEPNQVAVPGHKLILAMASPVFEAMFYGGMAERNEPIPILDVQPEAFRALLEYIYTDNINISSFDKACELCYGAKKYMLPHLVKECTRYLWSDLYPRNACRAYEFARLFEENVLMDKCIQIISTNTKEVLNDSSFEDVELNTVITVFSLDHLNIDSELDLFNAAARYAKAQEKRTQERSNSPPVDVGPPSQKRSKSPEPSTSKEKVVNVDSSAENSPAAVMDTRKPDEITGELPAGTAPADDDDKKRKEDTTEKDKPTIRSAIEKIRFLTLTPQQFAEGPARSSLLTETEAFAVLMNILSSISDVAMPSGFSMCRVPRKQLIGGGPSSGVRDVGTNPERSRFLFHGPQVAQNCYRSYPSNERSVFKSLNPQPPSERSIFGSIYPHPSNERTMFGSINCQPQNERLMFGSLNPQPPNERSMFGSLNPQPLNERSMFGSLNPQPPNERSMFGSLNPQPTNERSIFGSVNPQPSNQRLIFEPSAGNSIFANFNPQTSNDRLFFGHSQR